MAVENRLLQDNNSRRPSSSDREKLLQQRIEELELKLRHRDEMLASEHDRFTKAKKKMKQLLLKLEQRDAILAELREQLATARNVENTQSCGKADNQSESWATPRSACSGTHPTHRVEEASNKKQGNQNGLFAGLDLAEQERAEIVIQLEKHVEQMQAHIKTNEGEIAELEERQQAKQAEWNTSPVSVRSENAGIHWQAVGVIGQQIQEKKRFSAELLEKTEELKKQVAQQRNLIEASRKRKTDRSDAHNSASDIPDAKVEEPPDDERGALQRFLTASGDAAAVITDHPELRAAFENRPPALSDDALENCSQDERTKALSLFAVWVAKACSSVWPMRVSDLELETSDAMVLRSAFETCGARLEAWDMTRCTASDVSWRVLMPTMGSQPLRRLNLGYNTLGPKGTSLLVDGASAWTSTLEQLNLEMNRPGEKRCKELCKAMLHGVLPKLKTLELGWNELSPACAGVLSHLLRPEMQGSAPADLPLTRLERLGLAGNSLGSDGAVTLIDAALSCPGRSLDLDLSMNHVGSAPVLSLADWVEAYKCDGPVALSICLEWNNITEAKAVLRLVKAVGSNQFKACLGGACLPLVRLANNELTNIEPSKVVSKSGGLVVC